MRALVIVAHPHLEKSRVNRRWVNELRKQNPRWVTVHELYKEYPDFRIDVEREQALLTAHDRIVLQFPIQWYSTPALLKQWQDDVLTYGWAYGSNGNKLHGKELIIAFSAGGGADTYQAGGFNQFTIDEFLRPLQQVANLTGMKLLPYFRFYGAFQVSEEQLELSAKYYVQYIFHQNS
ncbi:NAD(P)H-dependent oxidoreductase [Laceyella putida]|uniref:NAD(P)H-dependent oxidoreductase n=1 Tax=Laceyella putida TaxID=110101 RepID=A0ABW2RGY8_9BACL